MHFSLRDDNLVVRAQGNQGNEMLAFIPWNELGGDLPPALTNGHVHWLNLMTKIVEIRPLGQPWAQSSENWRIECAFGQCRMKKGYETLVDIRSPTWAMVSECFKSLNNVDRGTWIRRYTGDEYLRASQSRNLLVTISPTGSVQSTSMQRLSVTLPRYGLSFFVNEREELESCDFKDMIYDEDQCVGALFGLENFLVLRPKTHISLPEAFIPRRVLIPNGFPKIHGNHQVWIDTDADYATGPDEPLYHTYDVDTELGCLRGNGSLASTRFLAHLHAMTSFHRPDPLTGKTGAQAALCLLQSAGCRSIMKFKALDDGFHWSSTQYPQLDAAYKEIRSRYYWDRRAYDHEPLGALEKRAARRAAYLFHSNATTGPTFPEHYCENKYLTTRITAEPGLATLPHSISSLPRQIALDQLLCDRPAPELPARNALSLLRDSHNASSDDIPLLDQLFSRLPASSSLAFQREYIAHLDSSAQCVHVVSLMTHKVAGENLIEALGKHYVKCRDKYMDSLVILKKSLGPTTDPHEQSFDRFGQWPPITADVLLRYLASTSPFVMPSPWKKCLISLALLLLELQRSRRLLRFALDDLEEEFSKELENEGCDGWNPEEYPDWLLIQVTFFCPNALLYLRHSSPLSGSRKLSHSSRSGRNCDGNHVPTIR